MIDLYLKKYNELHGDNTTGYHIEKGDDMDEPLIPRKDRMISIHTDDDLLAIQGRYLWRATNGAEILLDALKFYMNGNPGPAVAQKAIDEYHQVIAGEKDCRNAKKDKEGEARLHGLRKDR